VTGLFLNLFVIINIDMRKLMGVQTGRQKAKSKDTVIPKFLTYAFALATGIQGQSCGTEEAATKPPMIPVSLAVPDTSTKPAEPDFPTIKAAIQRALSKYGPWVNEVVDLDYTDGKETGIQLRVSRKGIQELLESSDIGGMGVIPQLLRAMYFPSPLNVLILSSEDPNVDRYFDHELGHGIVIKDKNRQFPTFLAGYSGPSAEEINAVVKRREDAIRRVGFLFMIETRQRFFESEKSISISFMQEFNQLIMNRNMLQSALQDPRIPAQVSQRYQELIASLVAEVNSVLIEAQSNQPNADPFAAARELGLDPEGDICSGDMGKIIPFWVQQLGKFNDLYKNMLRLAGSMQETNQDFESNFPQFYVEVTMNLAVAALMDQEGFKLDAMKEFYVSPAETWSRLFHSLMHVYVGEDCLAPGRFRLTEDEIKVFDAMRYNGQPMFQNAVSKYRLALRMLEDGVSLEEIRGLLEFAEHFKYKGETYLWPATNVQIVGEIPVIDKIDFDVYEASEQN